MKQLKAIISGGGTGGHIFPALAIAYEIRRRYPDSEILFVGALGRMEMEKIPSHGFNIIGLPVTGLPRKPGFEMFRFLVNLWKSVRIARQIIREFQPDVAIGVGGFASGPLLRAASKTGIPSLIQEQNSYAGITNRLLSGKVDKICVAYEGMERFFPKEKIILTGNPVRENLNGSTVNQTMARNFFGLKEGKKAILITGGSLGALSVNRAVIDNLDEISKSDVEVIWQTGSLYYERMVSNLEGMKPGNLHLHQFISKMDLAYAAADLIVSRAGAGTISEICMAGKPAILVPSPNVAEDHQTKNAQALVTRKAAVLIPDSEISKNLFKEAFNLLQDNKRLEELSVNCKRLAKPNAAKDIVDEIEKLLY